MMQVDVTVRSQSAGAEAWVLTPVADASFRGRTILIGETLWPVAAYGTSWIP